MQFPAFTLNDALTAYIQTFPEEERLEKYISSHGLADQRELIKRETDAVLKTAANILWDYPGGVPWNDAFVVEYQGLLQKTHSWLNDDGFAAICSFSKWLCWHEGLNRTCT